MAEIEKAFKKSYAVCSGHPSIFLPYILGNILSLFLVIFLFFSIILTLGIDLSSIDSLTEAELYLLLKNALTPGTIFFILFGVLAAIIVGAVINAAARGATVYYARQIIKNAEEQPKLFEGAKKYALSLFGFSVFMFFINAAAVSVFLVLVVLSSAAGGFVSAALAILLIFLLAVSLVVVNAGAIFSPQFIAGEDKGIISGLKESFGFVFSNLFSVFVYVIVSIFVIAAFAISTGIVSFIAEQVFKFIPFLKEFSAFLINILAFVAGAAISAYLETVKTAFVLER